jgi:hypothetical protein
VMRRRHPTGSFRGAWQNAAGGLSSTDRCSRVCNFPSLFGLSCP